MRKFLILLLLLASTLAAFAQDEPAAEEPAPAPAAEATEPTERQWRAYVTPVVWLANTTTDVTVGDRTRSATVRATDALGSFQAGGTARLEINNGEWGAFADLYFVNLQDELNVGPLGNIPVRTEVDNTIWQLAGTYRVLSEEDFHLDVLAGLRGYSIDVDLTVLPFTGPAGLFQFPGRVASRGLDFVDPIIGSRAHWNLSEDWDLDLYGDIGGFGAGSDFTYRLGTSVGYSVSESVSLRAGYLVLGFDYTEGSGLDQVEYKTTMYGPTLGATFKF